MREDYPSEVGGMPANNWQESVPLMALMFIGIIGVLYVLKSPSSNDASQKQKSYFTWNKYEGGNAQSVFASSRTNAKARLVTTGSLVENKPLIVRLENFNPEMSYLIDFGDGNRKAMRNKRVRYSYANSGEYQIKVYTENSRGKLTPIAMKWVAIHAKSILN